MPWHACFLLSEGRSCKSDPTSGICAPCRTPPSRKCVPHPCLSEKGTGCARCRARSLRMQLLRFWLPIREMTTHWRASCSSPRHRCSPASASAAPLCQSALLFYAPVELQTEALAGPESLQEAQGQKHTLSFLKQTCCTRLLELLSSPMPVFERPIFVFFLLLRMFCFIFCWDAGTPARSCMCPWLPAEDGPVS